MRNILRILFSIVFCIHFFSSYSQNDTIVFDDLLDMSLSDLLNIKVSGVSKKDEKIKETPQTVIIVTENDIIQRGYSNLEQIIQDLPGFDISRGNGTHYAQIYQRGYRSKNTDRTLLLIDGVEENDLWSGNVWLSRQYPTNNIKRVEIIYGPSSTMYGANAYVGVINVITKDPNDFINEKKKFNINANINYGTWNTRYADLSISSRYKNNVSFTVTGRIFKSNEMDLSGYDDFDYDISSYNLDFYKNLLNTDNNQIAQTAKSLDSTGYYTTNSSMGGTKPKYRNATNDMFLSGKLKMDNFTFGFQTWKRDEGFGAWYRDDFETGEKNNGRWVAKNSFLYVLYEKEINNKLSLSSFTRFKYHELDGSCQENYFIGYFNKSFGLNNIIDTTTGSIIQNPDKSYWYTTWWYVSSMQLRTELRIDYTINSKLDLVLGIEGRKSHIQGAYVASETPNPEETGSPVTFSSAQLPGGNHFEISDKAIFTQLNYHPTNRLKFIAGGRIDNNVIRKTQGYGTVFNSKLGMVYLFKKFNFKFIYSEAFKDPTMWTKYGTTLGRLLPNPDLQTEKVKNIEFNFGYEVSEHLYTEIVAYNSSYSNAVRTVSVPFITNDGDTLITTQHQSLGALNNKGIQARVKYKYKNYSFYSNYTYSLPYNIDSVEIRIGDIAAHQLNAGINAYYFNKLNINLRMNWVGEKPTGKMTTISDNPLDKIDSYLILNGAIYYRINTNFSVQLQVNNILNTEYFHPGVRSADGVYYASKLPQNERNFVFRILFDL